MKSASFSPRVPARNEFKCFHCRLIHPRRDGQWLRWDDIEVHLCVACERLTRNAPQRQAARGPRSVTESKGNPLI